MANRPLCPYRIMQNTFKKRIDSSLRKAGKLLLAFINIMKEKHLEWIC